jgi:hypothetical protein
MPEPTPSSEARLVPEDPERERILALALAARTQPEVEAARKSVREWISTHPEDTGIGFALDQLYRVEQAIQAVAATGETVPAHT